MRRVSEKRAAGLTKAPRRVDTGPTPAVRRLVKARDGWSCARCGTLLPEGSNLGQIHHRRSRGQGGSSLWFINLPANLVFLCGTPEDKCHGHVTLNRNRAEALAEGWVLRLNGSVDPGAVPDRHILHGWVLLDTAGGWSPAPMRGAA
jgi:5-methylcytosine-specific restriction endonuclease McrA